MGACRLAGAWQDQAGLGWWLHSISNLPRGTSALAQECSCSKQRHDRADGDEQGACPLVYEQREYVILCLGCVIRHLKAKASEGTPGTQDGQGPRGQLDPVGPHGRLSWPTAFRVLPRFPLQHVGAVEWGRKPPRRQVHPEP